MLEPLTGAELSDCDINVSVLFISTELVWTGSMCYLWQSPIKGSHSDALLKRSVSVTACAHAKLKDRRHRIISTSNAWLEMSPSYYHLVQTGYLAKSSETEYTSLCYGLRKKEAKKINCLLVLFRPSLPWAQDTARTQSGKTCKAIWTSYKWYSHGTSQIYTPMFARLGKKGTPQLPSVTDDFLLSADNEENCDCDVFNTVPHLAHWPYVLVTEKNRSWDPYNPCSILGSPLIAKHVSLLAQKKKRNSNLLQSVKCCIQKSWQ